LSPQPFRRADGGRIDRGKTLGFTFNGRRYEGHAGDTLASALLANGVRLVGRSFKYHRPRGILSAGADDPNSWVQIGEGAREVPNVPATTAELRDGLVARSSNCWPSLDFDLGAINDRLSKLFPAGFYYKTFMSPGFLWPAYEWVIRHVAGVGTTPEAPDPDRYDERHAHCDVLVVGAGPAGLSTALAAGRAGKRVILADDGPEAGGTLLGTRQEIANAPATDWVADTVAELAAMADVTVLPRTTVFGYYAHNYLAALERVSDRGAYVPRERLWQIRAGEVVLATGAQERPLVFDGNDRPGVMLAGAAQTYVNRYGVRPGRRAVVFTNNDSAYEAALDLANGGIEVAAIVDVRTEPGGDATDRARSRGLDVIADYAVVTTTGRKALTEVKIAPLTGGPSRRIACDLLCVSGGWSPLVHLHSQSGAAVAYDPVRACFLPGEAVQASRSIGAANGSFSLADCLGDDGPETSAALHEDPIEPFWAAPERGRGAKSFVDLFGDVTAADVRLAAREGYRSVEHFKRYTTAGMGIDQGKTGNINALALLARATGRDMDETGTTTFRPPYTPVTFGALAERTSGPLYDALRVTPMDAWHESYGAMFEDFGIWRRPRYYATNGATEAEAIRAECQAVRGGLGMLDASTLGKIDIQGPDAAEFLNRVYTNRWDTLSVGRCRYGVMLHEDGMVFDDGVTARLGENHYVMSTTTGGAAGVFHWLDDLLQTDWPALEVYLTSVTTQWVTVALAGPNSRQLLSEVCHDIDLSPEAFPFMAIREGTVASIPARVYSISFTGELSFEVNVPASYGDALWQALYLTGQKHGVTPFGVEAQDVLRTEKGHFIVGRDTDGTVTPRDLGLEWLISKKKGDFLGKRGLERENIVRDGRPQFVGLLAENADMVLPEGGQIITGPATAMPVPTAGHVTSSHMSPTLGRSIALALLDGGHNRMGETVTVWDQGKTYKATVASNHFYDPENSRMKL
jgi:sarcosine oxidase, subunit alpha